MKLRIMLFASLQEAAGWSRKTVECKEGSDLSSIWRILRRDEFGGKASDIRPLPVVNMERVRWDFVPSDGDEIAFLPPLSGG